MALGSQRQHLQNTSGGDRKCEPHQSGGWLFHSSADSRPALRAPTPPPHPAPQPTTVVFHLSPLTTRCKLVSCTLNGPALFCMPCQLAGQFWIQHHYQPDRPSHLNLTQSITPHARQASPRVLESRLRLLIRSADASFRV